MGKKSKHKKDQPALAPPEPPKERKYMSMQEIIQHCRNAETPLVHMDYPRLGKGGF